jgi:hypothetical protein
VGISIETVGFCPQYYAEWLVTGSRGDIYIVTLDGAEGVPQCSCPAWNFSPHREYDRECRHIRAVWEHGCLFNPQWRDPGPNDYAQFGITKGEYHVAQTWGEPCPGCGDTMIPVRIAV